MPYQQISLDIHDHIGLITLQRAQALNTFTAHMGREWDDAYRRCERDDDVRVIVVTGAGRAFCAGADMSGGDQTFAAQDDMDFSSSPVTPAWQLKKPVIAAVNGHAIGLGFSLALQCDFRIVADDAKYALLQAQRGVLADGNMHWLLPRLTGLQNALDIILTGRRLTGAELVAMNLALQAVPGADVLATAMQLAHTLAQQSSPFITALAKRLVWRGLFDSADAAQALETAVLHHSMGRPDAIEGGLAFVEKRAPRWQTPLSQHWPTDLLGE